MNRINISKIITFPLTFFDVNKRGTLMTNTLTIYKSRTNVTSNKIGWSFITEYEVSKKMPYFDLNNVYKKFDLKG